MSETIQIEEKTLENSPKGWIRWSGLGVFVGIVAAIVALSYFSLSTVVKHQIEQFASQAWGAKVEIGHLGFDVFPLGLTVNKIQLTDPDKPMENLLVLKKVNASLSLYHLVVGRTVIDDLSFSGLALHQPRKTSGALHKGQQSGGARSAKAKKAEEGYFAMPDLSLPNPDEMLKRETLETLTKAKEIQAKMAKIRQAWADLQAKLPNDKVVARYQKRFEALTKGDLANPAVLLSKQKEFETLKKDVEAQRKVIAEAQALMARLNEVKKDLQQLRKLPQKDYQRIMAKYSLDGQGMSHVTRLLFGSQIQHYVDLGRSFYAKAKPFIEKAKALQAEKEASEGGHKRAFGTDVAFREVDPQPDFIIKRLQGDADLAWGKVLLGISKLNFNHPKSRIPVYFKVEVQPIGQPSAMMMTGESNFIHPDKPLNYMDMRWQKIGLADFVLSADKTLPVVMRQGRANLTGHFQLVGLTQVQGKFVSGFKQVSLEVSQTRSKEVSRYVAPILKEVSHFRLEGAVSGNVLAPKIEVKSDLDRILSKAVNGALAQEMTRAKREVKKRLNQLLAEQTGPLKTQLASLLGQGKGLNADALKLDEILKGDLSATANLQKQVEAAAKKEAEKALQKQLQKQLGGIKLPF